MKFITHLKKLHVKSFIVQTYIWQTWYQNFTYRWILKVRSLPWPFDDNSRRRQSCTSSTVSIRLWQFFKSLVSKMRCFTVMPYSYGLEFTWHYILAWLMIYAPLWGSTKLVRNMSCRDNSTYKVCGSYDCIISSVHPYVKFWFHVCHMYVCPMKLLTLSFLIG